MIKQIWLRILLALTIWIVLIGVATVLGFL
jgi:hypothetical protein